MGQVLLDTNFILNCINQKIDFFEDLAGYKIIIPQEVINEIKKITENFLLLNNLILNRWMFLKFHFPDACDKRTSNNLIFILCIFVLPV